MLTCWSLLMLTRLQREVLSRINRFYTKVWAVDAMAILGAQERTKTSVLALDLAKSCHPSIFSFTIYRLTQSLQLCGCDGSSRLSRGKNPDALFLVKARWRTFRWGGGFRRRLLLGRLLLSRLIRLCLQASSAFPRYF